jgi:hypothetical protein
LSGLNSTSMSKKSIKLILNYSRSGGTLLTRVLGKLPDVLLLSEVNPNQHHSFHFDITYQMKKWHNVDVIGESFIEKVEFVYNWCNEHHKTLIIRDVTSFDFLPNPSNHFKPSGNFETYLLLKTHFPVDTICFVRDAIDIWISRDCPPYFSKHYVQYVTSIQALHVPILKYESFCKQPQLELEKICSLLNMPFDSSVLNTFYTNLNVTGDNQMNKPSRGFQLTSIQVLGRKRISRYLQQKLRIDKTLQQANRLLEYSTHYKNNEIPIENKPNFVKVELKFWIRKLLKRYPAYLE